jgi:hypothetical protein
MQGDLAGALIQIVLGAAVLAAVYYFSLATAMSDQLVQTKKNPQAMIPVIEGKTPSDISFVTDARLTMSGRDIVELPRSQNSAEGAQFSYSFWIRIPESSGDLKRVLLLRGDKTLAKFTDDSNGKNVTVPVTFAPLVIIERKGTTVSVSCHVNMSKDRNFAAVAVAKDGDTMNWTKWNLITVSVKDTSLYGEPTAGAMAVCVWINQTETAKKIANPNMGGLIENSGDLHVLPNDKFGSLQCGGNAVELRDMTYANFAMSSHDIYNKIAQEADRAVVPYKINRSDVNSQAFWDLSMQHLST